MLRFIQGLAVLPSLRILVQLKKKIKCWIVDGTKNNAPNPNPLKLPFSTPHLFSGSEFIKGKTCWETLVIYLRLRSLQPGVAELMLSSATAGRSERRLGLFWTESFWSYLLFSRTDYLKSTLHSPGTAYRFPVFSSSTFALVCWWLCRLPASIHCLLSAKRGLKWATEHRKQQPACLILTCLVNI